MAEQAPYVSRLVADADAVSGITVDQSKVVKSPVAGSVTGVTYTAVANLSGVTTNGRTLNVINHGNVDGSGVGHGCQPSRLGTQDDHP
jgi:hypothetical protein